MSSGLYSHTTRGTGTVLTAAIYNGDHQNHITNQNPQMTGAYSDNVTQMQLNTDPGGIGSESLAPSMAGELERLRFAIKGITGKAQWYAPPTTTLESLSGGVFTNPLNIATATNPPLGLRRTENDTVERAIQRLESGSGVGVDAEWRITGDGANGVAQVALFIGAVEMFRTSATRLVVTPQGYLSLSATLPFITADVIASTSLWYHPVKGNLVPLISAAGVLQYKSFATLQLTLNNPNHALDTIYDVYLWDNAGTPVIATGPGWSNSGIGTGSRGAAAALFTLNGLLVNDLAITGRNNVTTYAIPARTATYIGSILIDGTIGQVTAHRAFGKSRRWPVFNAYNQERQFLKAGETAASWVYDQNVIRAANNDAANSMLILKGLPDGMIDLSYGQNTSITSSPGGNANLVVGVGWNSVTVMSGKTGRAGIPSEPEDIGHISNAIARHFQVPAIGVHRASALELVPTGASGTVTMLGTEAETMLSARWMG